jgi:hypothetical protein
VTVGRDRALISTEATMQFSFSAIRTRLPLRYRRRISFRNNKIRMDVAGYANYERVWLLKWDIVLQWGVYDSKREQVPSRRPSAA